MVLLSNSFASFSVLSLSHAFYTVYLCILTIYLTMMRKHLVFQLQIFPKFKHLVYSYFLAISTVDSSNCIKLIILKWMVYGSSCQLFQNRRWELAEHPSFTRGLN